MVYISNEIVEEIFLRLPVKSLLRFRCVRKSWYKFLKHNSDFVKKHLLHSTEKNNYTVVGTSDTSGVFSIDYDQSLSYEVIQNHIDYPFKSESENIEIYGSCNGLLLFKLDWLTGLWNPATREYRMIPMSETPAESDWGNYPVRSCGFGYDHVGNNYKLVKIYSSSNDRIMVSKVEVYTMSSNSWKTIKDIPYKIRYGRLMKGVFVHEAIHWLADPCPIRSNNNFSQVLLSFNMAKETFCVLPLLEIFEDNNRFKHKCIDVLEGSLCMLCSHSSVVFEVWVMNDYGVKDSWTKSYDVSRSKLDCVISSFRHIRRIQPLKKGVILLEIEIEFKNGFSPRVALVFYDHKQERSWVREIDVGRWKNKVSTDSLSSMFHTETYVESLVSVHSGTYVGGGQEESYLEEAYEGLEF